MPIESAVKVDNLVSYMYLLLFHMCPVIDHELHNNTVKVHLYRYNVAMHPRGDSQVDLQTTLLIDNIMTIC